MKSGRSNDVGNGNESFNADFLDISYWRSICPQLSICEETSLAHRVGLEDPISVREAEWNECKDLIHEDGYFAYESFFSSDFANRLADSLARLEAHRVHPVFCFAYDEFWELLLRIRPLLQDLIGEHKLLPAVWSWIVRADHQTGFGPHRDQTLDAADDAENHLDYLTLWVPLTDLDHRSSSIFVLPASVDPNFGQGTSRTDVEDLQDIRSLQVSKGSVLAWSVGLVHWGSKQSRFGKPRMSVGYYVQKSNAECLVTPPLDFDRPFPLRARLSLIGQQILDYSRDRDMKLINMAKSLVELNAP